MNRLAENYKKFLAQTGSSITTATNGTSLDLGPNLLDDVCIDLLIGGVTGTTPTLDVTLQTSEDDATWTTESDAFPQYTDADATTVKVLGFNMNGNNSAGNARRYLRLVFTPGGTTPDFTVCAVASVRAAEAGAALNDNSAL